MWGQPHIATCVEWKWLERCVAQDGLKLTVMDGLASASHMLKLQGFVQTEPLKEERGAGGVLNP